MTRIILSTVRRYTPSTEPSGHIYIVDLDSREVLRKSQIVEAAYRGLDPNPRGGMRGSKGISIRKDQIALSNSMVVFRYDPNWDLLGTITHPSCAGIHDIKFQDETLWVTSARTDMLFQFDLVGNLLKFYNLRESSPALKSLSWKPPVSLSSDQIRAGEIDFRDPRTHREEESNNAHVNSLDFLSDGSILISLGFLIESEYAVLLRVKSMLMKMGVWTAILNLNNQIRSLLSAKDNRGDHAMVVRPAKARSAIIQVTPNEHHSLYLTIPDVVSPSHSLHVLPDETIIYLNTTSGKIMHLKPTDGGILSTTKITDGFLRGVTTLFERTLLLGSNNELITFDLVKQEVIERMQFTNDPDEFIYDLKLLPSNYSLPPVSFEDHFKRVSGYENIEALIEKK